MKIKKHSKKPLYNSSRGLKSGPSEDHSVHRWYRIIMGFDGRLVRHLIDRLSIKSHHLVLDPFCGSSTTLVECKKNGIPSIGIDANPVCVLASQVKTNWKINPESVTALIPSIIDRAEFLLSHNNVSHHQIFMYLSESGMIRRGWISAYKAKRLIALMSAIDTVCTSHLHRDFFRLALVSALVREIADIKFGPEVYCLHDPKRRQVVASFLRMARSMIDDLITVRKQQESKAETKVFLADSRNCKQLLSSLKIGPVDFIITSPPYPNEHDYTRCTRLELVFLGYISNNAQLRLLKRTMIRSHTKGIYVDDVDHRSSEQFKQVVEVALKLEKRAINRTDGFSKLYGKVIREYFGGMTAHLKAAYHCLKPKGMCAYVVCDQQSLLGVYIDTPGILKAIATSPEVGFKFVEIINWKKTRGSTGDRTLTEKIVILTKPEK